MPVLPVQPLLAGYLDKHKPGKKWKRRFFVHNGPSLFYYDPAEYVPHSPAGVINLCGATVAGSESQISVVESKASGGLSFELRASSTEEMRRWVLALTRPTNLAHACMPAALPGTPMRLEGLQAQLGWSDDIVVAVRKACADSIMVTADYMTSKATADPTGSSTNSLTLPVVQQEAKDFFKGLTDTRKSSKKLLKKSGPGQPRDTIMSFAMPITCRTSIEIDGLTNA